MNVVVLGFFADNQTAHYILEAFKQLKYKALGVDIRLINKDFGMTKAQDMTMKEIENIGVTPDLIMVLKGLELTNETLLRIKKTYPEAILCNWFFDKYLGLKPIYETIEYFETIKLFDYYFCSLKGVADKLIALGLENVRYLDEACSPRFHGEKYLNNFQKKKYGADVSFAGTVGLRVHHPQRIKVLDKVISEGFSTKIWGNVIGGWEYIPPTIKEMHINKSVINEDHSKVVQSSLINLGIDQDTAIEFGYSARLFRVLCAGGLYLVNGTKGIGNVFKVNQRDKEITGEEDLIVYYNGDDLIKKLDFLLEHDELREKIAKNGQKKVLAEHKFTDRIEELLNIIKNDRNKINFRGD